MKNDAPRPPSAYDLQDAGRGFPPNYLHESWRDYLYWDIELDQDDDGGRPAVATAPAF